MPTLSQAIELVSAPPGNLIYHLVVVFALSMAASVSLNAWQQLRLPAPGRLAVGAGLLLLGRLALVLTAGLASQGLAASGALLPPVDRAVGAAALAVLVWLLAFPEPHRTADVALAGVLFLLTLGAVVAVLTWAPLASAGLPYNGQSQETLWEALKLLEGLAGLGLLLWRRPPGWGAALAILALLLLGVAYHLIVPPETSSYPGAERLAELAALPLLAMFAMRRAADLAFQRSTLEPSTLEPSTLEPSTLERSTLERSTSNGSPDPRALLELATLALHNQPLRLQQAVCAAVARTLVADICLFIEPPEEHAHLTLAAGFDLIRETAFPTLIRMPTATPALASAIRRGKLVRLPADAGGRSDRYAADLGALGEVLGVREAGPAMLAPLTLGERPLGALVLLSAYSRREWSAQEQRLLAGLAGALPAVLAHAREAATLSHEAEQLRVIAGEAAQREEIARQNLAELSSALSAAERQIEDERAQSRSLAALVSRHSETEAERDTLLAGLQAEVARLQEEAGQLAGQLGASGAAQAADPAQSARLRAALEDARGEAIQLSSRVAQAEAELARLRQAGAAAPAPPAPPQGPEPAPLDSEAAAVVAALAQDLRQPMSSIIGYTDLLLGESVGILGALQRKFLERVKISIERMNALLDDLIRITAIDSGTLSLAPETVDVMSVIDEAFMSNGTQFREKGILLRMDIPDELPPLTADRDAFQQIVSHLLANAGAASRPGGEVVLTAREETSLEHGSEKNYLMLSVADSGGGIAPQDLPRVFTRVYRADNPLIDGLGDTGVGLSIVRTLVTAHGGRIWVDSEIGKGSTFSIILPVNGTPRANGAGA